MFVKFCRILFILIFILTFYGIILYADSDDVIPIKCEVGDILYFHKLETVDLAKNKMGHTAIYAGQFEVSPGNWADFMFDCFPKRGVSLRTIESYLLSCDPPVNGLFCSGLYTHIDLSDNTYSFERMKKRLDIWQLANALDDSTTEFTEDGMLWEKDGLKVYLLDPGVNATSLPQNSEDQNGNTVYWTQTDSTHRTIAPFTSPTINYNLYQKGQSRNGTAYYVCVGFAEDVFEKNGLNIIPESEEFIEA